MQEYCDSAERESLLLESVKELDLTNRKLAKLKLKQEELTDNIIAALGHNHEGQRSYEYDIYKLEVKTPMIYSLNKSMYEEVEHAIPESYNPVRKSVSYTVDKKLCDDYLRNAPFDVYDLLVDLIEKKPGKPSVTIKHRV